MSRIFLTLLIVFVCPLSSLFAAEPEMKAHFIDVGQGAATLLEFPTGAILIDTGGQGEESTTNLVKFLQKFFLRRTDLHNHLNALIISHPHLDHTRGMQAVLSSCNVEVYIDNGIEVTSHDSGFHGVKFARDLSASTGSPKYRPVLDTEIQSLADLTGLTDGEIDSITAADCDPKIRILSGGFTTNPGWDSADFDNKNNQSLAVRVDFDQASFLFCGDMQEAAIATFVDYYKSTDLLDVDAFLVNHHGSHNGTTPELLSAVTPDLAVIAMGKPVDTHETFSAFAFGHPRHVIIDMISNAMTATRKQPIDILVADGVKNFVPYHLKKNIYGTGCDGTITVTATKSGKFTIETEVVHSPSPLIAGPGPHAAHALAPPAVGPATPNQPFQWNLTVPEKNPPAGTANGKTVLFDLTHGGATGQSDWVIEGGFSDFADALVAKGYKVREYWGVDKDADGVIRFVDDRDPANLAKNEAEIQFNAIKDADVFIMSESNRPFRIDEQEALRQFVASGKGLFFIADHYNADRNLDSWDATEVYNGYNRSTNPEFKLAPQYGDLRNPQDANAGWLAKNFGVRFRFNAINCLNGASDVVPETESEGVTKNVQKILMAASSTLAVVDDTKAKGIVFLKDSDNPKSWPSAVEGATGGLYFKKREEGPLVALSKPSAGKAAFIGDSSPIEDSSPKYRDEIGGNKKSLHNGWQQAGNAATLAVNIVDWLATSENYVGFDGTNGHSKGTQTPAPLAPQEQDDPDDGQPWRPIPPNYNPWDPTTFAAGSFGAPFPFAGGAGGGNNGGGNNGGGGTVPAGPALSVADALAKPDGTKVTVIGIISDEFNDQFGLILKDAAGAQTLVVQIPKDNRAAFSPKLNPSVKNKKIQVAGKRALYANQPGIRDVTSLILAP